MAARRGFKSRNRAEVEQWLRIWALSDADGLADKSAFGLHRRLRQARRATRRATSRKITNAVSRGRSGRVMRRGKMYYAKLSKGRSMFVAPRLVPFLTRLRRAACERKEVLSPEAQKILKVLRKEWEMATADLRSDAKIDDRKA